MDHTAIDPLQLLTSRRTMRRGMESVIAVLLTACALVSIVILLGIVAVLSVDAIRFFMDVPITDFLFGTTWEVGFRDGKYGVLPLVAGTLMVGLGSAIVAIPLGLLTAILLSEYAPARMRNILKPVLEILAGIPTVVYGYFALLMITPFLQAILGPVVEGYNALSAILVVAIMILPTIATLCDDAMRSVPRSLREAGHALGANRFEVSVRIVLPAALSGVIASFVLAISRAIGETMAVTIAAGARPSLSFNPLNETMTMTAFMVNQNTGDAGHFGPEFYSLFAVGLLLFLMTLVMNLFASQVMRRFREVYE